MIRFQYQARSWMQKTMPDILAIFGGRVPSFVYGGAVHGLPTFVYHIVDRSFEDDLIRLRRGGYRTVGAEELARAARGTWTPGGRDVALTFDDGHASVTSIAAPLLERHQYRGIAFVVSGLVPATSSETYAGWDALSEWVSRGVLEVGAHSLYHQYVPTGPDIIGIMSPSLLASFLPRMIMSYRAGDGPERPGMPILVGRPRYAAWRAFRPDYDVLARRAAPVRQADPATLNWPAYLRQMQAAGPVSGTYETDVESARAIRDDMAASMSIIEDRCPNPAARHLSYPWYAGDERTDRLAASAGAAVVYKGVLNPTMPARWDRPPCMQRLPFDFLRLLPGTERASLATIARRRLIAHRR